MDWCASATPKAVTLPPPESFSIFRSRHPVILFTWMLQTLWQVLQIKWLEAYTTAGQEQKVLILIISTIHQSFLHSLSIKWAIIILWSLPVLSHCVSRSCTFKHMKVSNNEVWALHRTSDLMKHQVFKLPMDWFSTSLAMLNQIQRFLVWNLIFVFMCK
jgi:hypothetical protein